VPSISERLMLPQWLEPQRALDEGRLPRFVRDATRATPPGHRR
jgi:hypothetical protein